MTREETVVQTLVDRGFTGFQAKKLAHEIIRNLVAYSRIQDQRQQYLADLTRKAQR